MHRLALLVVGCLAVQPIARSQVSSHALRFFGTGTNQADRVRIRVDDDMNGPNASAPCDVGAGSFTIEMWLQGSLSSNATSNAGGDGSFADNRWIDGNIVFDRDIWGGSDRDFGVSIAGGFVRFGTGRGDAFQDGENTIEGNVSVLDGAWHQVALVRNASNGRKQIFVDGQLDFASALGVSSTDLSYPDAGAPGQVTQWGPFIVLAAEKHDAGAPYPSFNGWLDEVRVWNVARTPSEIAASWNRLVAPGSTGLVASWRFEEGAGTSVTDTSGAGSPTGELIAGVAGNGQWVSFASNPANTAPILGAAFVSACVGDGSSGPCPCGNTSPPGSGRGCATSLSSGALLSASGNADVSSDDVVLLASGMPDGPALYFQGTALAGSTPFGDGLLCVAGSILRLGVRFNVAGASQLPGAGDPPLAVMGLVPANGGNRSYQVWFRDAANFCTSATYNLGNALQVSWSP